MAEYERNHYIPNKVVKNFATREENGKYKINIIDLQKQAIIKRNSESAFYEKNLYDVKNEDVKKLEKDLKTKIEEPFYKILYRLVNEEYDTFIITREELEIIKKFLLIQQYRNLKNSFGYCENFNKDGVLSRYNIKDDESLLDFWKREIQAILDNSLEDLVLKNDLVGVKFNTRSIYTGFLMFVHTTEEFVLNDLGCVTERLPIKMKFSPEEYCKMVEEVGKNLFGVDGFGHVAKKRAEENSEFMDNFLLFPVSSDLAILVVDEFWKTVHLNALGQEFLDKWGISPSLLLSKHFSLPKNDFVNKHIIKNMDDVQKYKSKYDKYTYKILEMDEWDTIYINNLLMNESYRYIGFKTKDKIMPSIAAYVIKQMSSVENVKNDLMFAFETENNKQ